MTYVFVGGSQRSGTSIMQQLLCQSPLANPYVYEASYVRLLVNVHRTSRDSWSKNFESYFGDRQGLYQFNSLIVRAFLEHARQHLNQCTHLVLKEPHLTMVWPDLFELVPDARFLLMIRDPRDIVASLIEVNQRHQASQQLPADGDGRDIADLCRQVIAFYAPALNCQDPGFKRQLGVVIYENLVTNPQQTLADISAFTGIDFTDVDTTATPKSGHVDTKQLQSEQTYAPWLTSLSGKPVSETRIGNHRRILQPAEIAEVEEHCAALMASFGYQSTTA